MSAVGVFLLTLLVVVLLGLVGLGVMRWHNARARTTGWDLETVLGQASGDYVRLSDPAVSN